MVVLVPVVTEDKKEEILSIAQTRPDIFVTSGRHFALATADEPGYLVFDSPMGVLEHGEQYVRLLALEYGSAHEVMREHLNTAFAFGLIERLF